MDTNDPRSPSDPQEPPFEPPIRGPQDAQRFWQQFGRAGGAGTRRERDPRPGNGGPAAGPARDHDHECLEWCPICRTAEVVRAGAPPEIRDQFQGLQRDALVAVRALLDAYLDRLDHAERRSSARVEDIPIA